ncbi:MAG: hypothetical protein RLZZ303_2980 [Candidatus Hydrogenedentota bacterium]|jgi:hypothetical protein
MDPKISDLTVQEFKLLITETVGIAIQDALEDAEASRSDAYLASIKAAREEHAAGEAKSFEQVFGEL